MSRTSCDGIYLGLDAGNSKTVALVADSAGRLLGRGRGPGGDIYGHAGADAAVDAVVGTVDAALRDAGVDADAVDAAALRLAGVDWPEDETFWAEAIRTRLPSLARFSVRNDGYALLRCGRPDGVGLAVTAGSGPAVAARGDDGREYCSCFWIQHLLAGRGLGEAAMRAVVDADLGIAPPTRLTTELLTLFGYDDVGSLLHAFTRRERPRAPHETWAAARPVLAAAGAGDPVASGIVAHETGVLARLGRVAAERTGLLTGESVSEPGPVPVVLGGSILTSEHPAYRDALVEALVRELGQVRVAATSVAPVTGALLDALAEGGVELEPALHEQLIGEVHPVDFLLT